MSIVAELYAEQLAYLKYGYPMWHPESLDMENVMVGDVGIITTNGHFRHMFSAARSIAHRRNQGLPVDGFEQLKFNQSDMTFTEDFIPHGVYHSKSLRVELRDVPVAEEDSPSHIRVDFTCSGENGAMLALPTHAAGCHLKPIRSRLFVDYIKNHHSDWFGMSRTVFALNIEPDDIILVKGWVKTTAFTTAAITHKRYSSTFYPGDTFGRVNRFRFTPTSSQIIQYRIGPDRPKVPVLRYSETDADFGTDVPAEEEENYFSKTYEQTMEPIVTDDATLYPYPEVPTLRDQAVFLSFYKLKRRSILPEKIVAYAEDKDLPPSSPSNEGATAQQFASNDSRGLDEETLNVLKWKPLEELLEYLLRHSNAALAIACDEDVYAVCEGHTWPDDFKEFYERISPPVYVEDEVATLYRDEYLPEAVQQKDICTVSGNLMSRDPILMFTANTPLQEHPPITNRPLADFTATDISPIFTAVAFGIPLSLLSFHLHVVTNSLQDVDFTLKK